MKAESTTLTGISLSELLQLWRKDELTVEQVAGYLLQHILGLTQRLDEVEKCLRDLKELLVKPAA